MPEPLRPYTVFVDDNYHYMDESERYQQGVYETVAGAVAACKMIVDDFLRSAHKPGMTSDQLIKQYVMFGEDPWISPKPEGGFSARDYARAQCIAHCRAEDEARKIRRVDAPIPELAALKPVIAAVLARKGLTVEQRRALELMLSQTDAFPRSFPDRSFVLILEHVESHGAGSLRTTFSAELTPTSFRLQWDAWKYESRSSSPEMSCLAKLKVSFYGSGLGDERAGSPDAAPQPMARAAAEETGKLIVYSQAWDRNR